MNNTQKRESSLFLFPSGVACIAPIVADSSEESQNTFCMNSCIHCHKTQQLGSITYSARSRPNWLCCLAGGFYNLQISCKMYSEPLRHTLTNKMTYLHFHLKSTQHTRFPKKFLMEMVQNSRKIWNWNCLGNLSKYPIGKR